MYWHLLQKHEISVLIITLHRVSEGQVSPNWSPNKDLAIQIESLVKLINDARRKGYYFASMRELSEWTSTSIRISDKRRKLIILTFDDGYIDNYTLAKPVLEQYEVPYIIYVTTSFIDKPFSLPWWYALEKVLDTELNEALINCPLNKVPTNSKEEVFLLIRQYMLDSCYSSDLTNWLDKMSDSSAKQRLFMNWDECREINQSELGTIGSHAVSHCNMNAITEAERYRELSDSLQCIREKLGSKPSHFAYPYGSSQELFPDCERLLSSLGYDSGVTTCPGYYQGEKKYEMPRMMVTDCRSLTDIENILRLQAAKKKLKAIASFLKLLN